MGSDSRNLLCQFPARNSLPDRINVHFVNRFLVRTFLGHLWFGNGNETAWEGISVDVMLVVEVRLRKTTDLL